MKMRLQKTGCRHRTVASPMAGVLIKLSRSSSSLDFLQPEDVLG